MSMVRRRFLRGMGGVVVGLPFLRSLAGSDTVRAQADRPIYTVFVRQANGVAQAGPALFGGRQDPERFWPRTPGPISTQSLRGTDADRAVSELADYADKLLVISGTTLVHAGHGSGAACCLTAARLDKRQPDDTESFALGESIDWRIGRELNRAGVEPLYLRSGGNRGYFRHGISYTGPGLPRGAESNPMSVYMDMIGLTGQSDEIANRIIAGRNSANDYVREEMQALMASPRLGSADRALLTAHFEMIRDTERGMACSFPADDVAAMQAVARNPTSNDIRLDVARLHMNLIAFAFACDLNRTAVLEIGDGSDSTIYSAVNGVQTAFHRISHRVDNDGGSGPVIPDAERLHHEIDRLMGRTFKHLLDRLTAYTAPGGDSLLDNTIATWTSDIARGNHSVDNHPFVLAGSGGGFLRQGQYVDVRRGGRHTTHNKLLNTILSAVGFRNSAGEYFDDFGSEEHERGTLSELHAS